MVQHWRFLFSLKFLVLAVLNSLLNIDPIFPLYLPHTQTTYYLPCKSTGKVADSCQVSMFLKSIHLFALVKQWSYEVPRANFFDFFFNWQFFELRFLTLKSQYSNRIPVLIFPKIRVLVLIFRVLKNHTACSSTLSKRAFFSSKNQKRKQSCSSNNFHIIVLYHHNVQFWAFVAIFLIAAAVFSKKINSACLTRNTKKMGYVCYSRL